MNTLTANLNGTLTELETKQEPLWWQSRGLQFTASGYGRRIPTPYMVKLPGSPRWRRVYCCIYSNSGTCYIEDRRNPGSNGRPGWIVVC